MKYFISIDMEGIWGTGYFGESKEKVASLMTEELKKVVDALFEYDVDAFVRVCDSHALGLNLIIEELGDRLEIVRGFPRTFYMMEGLSEEFDAVLFVGYHAPSGYIHASMDHTYSSSSFFDIRVNGQLVGESEINAILASCYNVPVVFISGDKALYEFSKERFGDVEFLVTKEAKTHSSVLLYNRKVLDMKRKEKIKNVIDKLTEGKFNTFSENNPVFKPPYEIIITVKDTLRADLISIMPYVKRLDGRRLLFKSESFSDIYRFIVASSIIAWQAIAIK